jgi:hypothetical protein
MKEIKADKKKQYSKPVMIELKIDEQFNRLLMSPQPQNPHTSTSPTTGDDF